MEENKQEVKGYYDKSVLERHTVEGKFNLGAALNEQDARIKNLVEEVKQLKEAMGFMATWWEENYGSKLILPTQDQVNQIIK